MTPNIIGLTGYAQHGKNTASLALEDIGYRPLAFADQLRKLAAIVNPIIHSVPDVPAGEWNYVRYAGMVETLGYESAKQHPEVRRILQDLGTGVRDVIGQDAWVAALRQKVLPGVRYVITDVRFPNEAEAITDMGGEVWRVTRPNFDNGLGTGHPSEAHIDSLPVAMTLVNDGTTEDLQNLVRQCLGLMEHLS